MELEPNHRKLEETVTGILKAADLDIATDLSVRKEAEKLLGADLSDIASKRLVRQILESFLLSTSPADEVREETEEVEEIQKEKSPVIDQTIASDDGGGRIICRLPGMKRVSIENYKGLKLVSVKKYYQKQGKVFPSGIGVTLNPKEWSVMCSNFADIEEAITKMESRIREEEHIGKKQRVAEASNPSTILASEADTC